MDAGNKTGVLEFLLLRLSEDPELQSLLFGLFLPMYLVSMLWNLLIILAVSSDSRLHTPMYFFLSHLSFSDICFNFTIIPKMLVNIQTASKDFACAGCITQMYFYLIFRYLDHFLLTVMAYVHFVAICHPLHYVIMMNSHLCCLLALVSLSLSFLIAVLYSLMVLCLSFCTHIEIPHFFCELTEVLQSSCSDALRYYIVLFSVTGLLGIPPLTGVLYSYSRIISSILKMPSVDGKYKAFSTCGSHLTVISSLYGSGLGVYLRSAFSPSSSRGTVASVTYTVLNTFFYSLRNRDIPGALRTFVSRSFSPS